MSASNRQIKVRISGREYLVEVADLEARPVIATVEGQSFEVYPEEGGGSASVPIQEKTAGKPVAVMPPPAPGQRPAPAPDLVIANEECYIIAPMPGDIIEILVAPGDQVGVGQELCSLEAMKMKNAIRAPRTGTVKIVEVTPGQAVAYGDVLIIFE